MIGWRDADCLMTGCVKYEDVVDLMTYHSSGSHRGLLLSVWDAHSIDLVIDGQQSDDTLAGSRFLQWKM